MRQSSQPLRLELIWPLAVGGEGRKPKFMIFPGPDPLESISAVARPLIRRTETVARVQKAGGGERTHASVYDQRTRSAVVPLSSVQMGRTRNSRFAWVQIRCGPHLLWRGRWLDARKPPLRYIYLSKVNAYTPKRPAIAFRAHLAIGCGRRWAKGEIHGLPRSRSAAVHICCGEIAD